MGNGAVMPHRGLLRSIALVIAPAACASRPKKQVAPPIAQTNAGGDSTRCHIDALIKDSVLYGNIVTARNPDSLYAWCRPGHPWLKVF